MYACSALCIITHAHRSRQITNKAFENYTLTCIEHFKFVDKMEIIQKDYANIKEKSSQNKKFNFIKYPLLITFYF